jgi:hypothetical protein
VIEWVDRHAEQYDGGWDWFRVLLSTPKSIINLLLIIKNDMESLDSIQSYIRSDTSDKLLHIPRILAPMTLVICLSKPSLPIAATGGLILMGLFQMKMLK